jgi:hypothetical protein
VAVTVPALSPAAVSAFCMPRSWPLIYNVAVVLGNVARQRPHMSVEESASYRRQCIVLSVNSSACL